MLKRILGIVIVVLVLAVVIGMLLPRHVHVERRVGIDRPASLVYATVNSFQLFPKWSPWQDLDPHMDQHTEGPREGVGAKLIWSGNGKVGSGSQLITASIPDRSVASDLNFGAMGVAKSKMTISPDAGSTRVTWSLDIDMGLNPIGHYFGLTMDRMIGGDFATGLSKLKALVESMPDIDIAGFEAARVQMTAAPVLLVTETTAYDSIANAYADGFTQIAKVMAKNKLHQAGAPFGIDGEATRTSLTFDAGIPVDHADADAGAGGVRAAESYGGAALKTTHVGPYEGLAKTRSKLLAYVAAHGYTQKGPTFNCYIDDPGSVPAEKLRTEVYVPID